MIDNFKSFTGILVAVTGLTILFSIKLSGSLSEEILLFPAVFEAGRGSAEGLALLARLIWILHLAPLFLRSCTLNGLFLPSKLVGLGMNESRVPMEEVSSESDSTISFSSSSLERLDLYIWVLLEVEALLEHE